MIVFDIEKLKIKTNIIPSEEEIKNISKELFEFLVFYKSTYCVSANQLGYNFRIAAFSIPGRQPFYLVDPKVLKKELLLKYVEDDVSFPNKLFQTYRYARVQVSALNLKKPFWFGLLNEIKDPQSPEVLEAVCVQHMIDSLDGILITERNKKPENEVVFEPKKFKRNDIIVLEKGDKILEVKYKRIQNFLDDGWKIKN